MNKYVPCWTTAVLLVCAAVFAVPEIQSFFIYDRAALFRGQVWRFLSAPLVHFDLRHLVYNALAFGVMGWIAERRSSSHFVMLCVLSALSGCVMIMAVKPGMYYYGGMSGIACSLTTFHALDGLSDKGASRGLCAALLFIVLIKIFFELYTGGTILPYPVLPSFTPEPLCHLAGVIAALFLFFIVNRNRPGKGLITRLNPPRRASPACPALTRTGTR